MRGRLRVIDGDESVTWSEVPVDYWDEILKEGDEVPIIQAPTLTPGSEIPNYEEDIVLFSIKVHHDGDFDEKLENYVGGKASFFDNCSMRGFCLVDVESMLSELGLSKGSYDIWFCLPDMDLDKGLCQIEGEDEVSQMIELICYSHCFKFYTTRREVCGDFYEDFSFTQLALDEREERVSRIMEKFELDRPMMNEEVGDENGEKDVDQGEDDIISFQGDSSNMDSSESEVETTIKRKKNRIPPPNPPYRTRKRGRYSMLRGLFKNTEENPVVLDHLNEGTDGINEENTEKLVDKKRKKNHQ